MFNPFAKKKKKKKIYTDKTCFSAHIIDYSVNFTWFALLNPYPNFITYTLLQIREKT